MKLDVEIWFTFNMLKGQRLKHDTIPDASSDGDLIDVMPSPAGTVGTMWIYQQTNHRFFVGLEMEFFFPQEMAILIHEIG